MESEPSLRKLPVVNLHHVHLYTLLALDNNIDMLVNGPTAATPLDPSMDLQHLETGATMTSGSNGSFTFDEARIGSSSNSYAGALVYAGLHPRILRITSSNFEVHCSAFSSRVGARQQQNKSYSCQHWSKKDE